MIDFILGLLCVAAPVGIIFWGVKSLRKGKKRHKISSIKEIFSTDMEHFDPNDYEVGEAEENVSGSVVQNYYRDLEPEEAGVFRRLNVKEIGEGGRNFIFSNRRVTKYNRDHLRRLVDKIVSLYGSDDNGKGNFTKEDDEDIDHYQFWSGRTWTKNKNYNHLSIYYDEEAGLSMTIWTTIKKED